MDDKKEYRTLEEWRRQYREKESLLREKGFEEVLAKEFYRELFPDGSLQKKGVQGDGKGCIVGCQILKTRRKITVVCDDLGADLDKLTGGNCRFGLIGPYSCYGRSYKIANIHQLFGIAIDVDYVGRVHLKRLLQMFADWENPDRYHRLPPTYLVSSGRGVHLYYFLDEPLDMYKYRVEPLNTLKADMVKYLWNDFTSMKGDEPDTSSIAQGFRCVGSLSKICLDKERDKVVTTAYPVKAFRISGRRYNLEELAEACGSSVDVKSIMEKPEKKNYKSAHSLEEAKELYPEWYQRRIVEKQPRKPHKKTWTCNKALYEWWLRKMDEEAKVGGRYFAVVALCCYGVKCGISPAKIRRDAWKNFSKLEALTDDEANHFQKQDMRDALSTLEDPILLERTRDWIERRSKIAIPANKRNGRKLKAHIQMLNATRKFRKEVLEEDEYKNNGRPNKAQIVEAWRKTHPGGKKVECIRETGLSKPTVYKWWNTETN